MPDTTQTGPSQVVSGGRCELGITGRSHILCALRVAALVKRFLVLLAQRSSAQHMCEQHFKICSQHMNQTELN